MLNYPIDLKDLSRPEDLARLVEILKTLLAGTHIVRIGDKLVVKNDQGKTKADFDLSTGNLRIAGTIAENHAF